MTAQISFTDDDDDDDDDENDDNNHDDDDQFPFPLVSVDSCYSSHSWF